MKINDEKINFKIDLTVNLKCFTDIKFNMRVNDKSD